jgi:hypothetical protein
MTGYRHIKYCLPLLWWSVNPCLAEELMLPPPRA